MEKEIRDMVETRTAHYLKYLCEHGKYKYQCRECKGSQICPHNKRKPQCQECAGSQICPHSRKKQTCKKCSDPITVNIEQWIFTIRSAIFMTQTDLSTSAFWKDSLKTTNNVITVIAKSTCNIQNIKMISPQSRDLIIRLVISRAIAFYVA